MSFVNLLPWREAARKQRQLKYLQQLAQVALVAFVLMFLLMWLVQARTEGQKVRNSVLEAENQLLDKKLYEIRLLNQKKKDLEQRLALIEQLQQRRNLGTQIFDQIAHVVPDGVYLTGMDKKANQLLLTGRSESNNRLSTMLRQVEQSGLLRQPLLEFIQADADDQRGLSDFKMHMLILGAEPVAPPPEPVKGKGVKAKKAGSKS
ncbi:MULTISPECIES: PilN domain-containing protein [Rheinheimera]|uniref:PilN domain-containing protein n=1 Tax=Rheinheimera marina TaxID=1774958 RepID=A0ABV9JMW9_9GAMM